MRAIEEQQRREQEAAKAALRAAQAAKVVVEPKPTWAPVAQVMPAAAQKATVATIQAEVCICPLCRILPASMLTFPQAKRPASAHAASKVGCVCCLYF
jgi:hypothetical protein